ncbi:uncharacterized protein LOC115211089 [Argonauta hians]
MAPSDNSSVDIAKESLKIDSVVKCVSESLDGILAGNIKLCSLPKFCSNITLTYALYIRLLDFIKIQPLKPTETLYNLLKFLFPDLVPFLPSRIASFSASIRYFTERSRKVGNVESIYQPIPTIYAAKLEAEWQDFTQWGVTKSMLITGPLIAQPGCKRTLTHKHIVTLCRLRNSYHLCWIKVVPKWLHYFGVLSSRVLLKPIDIKRQWTDIVEQSEQLEGEELTKFLNTVYQLPVPSKPQRSFKTEDSVSADVSVSSSYGLSDVPSSNKGPSSYKDGAWARNLQEKVDELQLLLENKDREMASFLSKITEREQKIEHLTLKLSKMKMLKNHWLMKYRKLAGVNLFAEDSEFDVNLQLPEKVKENTKCIRRTLSLACSSETSKFVDKFLDDSFVEQLLECVIAHGLNIELSSNVVLMFLQELVLHSEKKILNSVEALANGIVNCDSDVMVNCWSDFASFTNQGGNSLSSCNTSLLTNPTNSSLLSHDLFLKDSENDDSDKWSDLHEKTFEISQIDPKILSEATSGKNCQDGADWPSNTCETSPIEVLNNSSILLNAELFSKMALAKSDAVTGDGLSDLPVWDTENSLSEISKNLLESEFSNLSGGGVFTPNYSLSTADSKHLSDVNASLKPFQKAFGPKHLIFRSKDYNELDILNVVGGAADIWSNYNNKLYRRNHHNNNNNNYNNDDKHDYQTAEFNNNNNNISYIDITADSDSETKLNNNNNNNNNPEHDFNRKMTELNKLRTETTEQLSVKITTATITKTTTTSNGGDDLRGACTEGFLSETSINTITSKPLKDPAIIKKRPRGRPKGSKRIKIRKTS